MGNTVTDMVGHRRSTTPCETPSKYGLRIHDPFSPRMLRNFSYQTILIWPRPSNQIPPEYFHTLLSALKTLIVRRNTPSHPSIRHPTRTIPFELSERNFIRCLLSSDIPSDWIKLPDITTAIDHAIPQFLIGCVRFTRIFLSVSITYVPTKFGTGRSGGIALWT